MAPAARSCATICASIVAAGACARVALPARVGRPATNAGQRSAYRAGAQFVIQQLRLGPRRFALDHAPALHLLLDRIDPVQAYFQLVVDSALAGGNVDGDIKDRARVADQRDRAA